MGTMRNKRAREAHRPSLQAPLPTPEQTTDTTDAAPVGKPTRGRAPKAIPAVPTRRSGRTQGTSTSDAAPHLITARPSGFNIRRASSTIATQDPERESAEELHVDAVMVAAKDVVSSKSVGDSVADEEEYEELDIEEIGSSSDDESEAPQHATAGKKASQPKGHKQPSQAKSAELQVELTSVLFKYPYSEDQVSYSQILLDIENVEWAVMRPRLIDRMPWKSIHITLGYQILPVGSAHRKQWLTLINESDWTMLVQSLRNAIRSERAKRGGGKDLEVVLQNRLVDTGSKKGGKNAGPTNLKPQAPGRSSFGTNAGDADIDADTQSARQTQISLTLITIRRRHACQRAQCKNGPCYVLPNGEHHKFNNAELKYWAEKVVDEGMSVDAYPLDPDDDPFVQLPPNTTGGNQVIQLPSRGNRVTQPSTRTSHNVPIDSMGSRDSMGTAVAGPPMPRHSASGSTSTTKPNYPLITNWLSEIDKDTEDRNQDGRNFSQYAPIFCDLELFRLDELGDITINDLRSAAPGKFTFGIASAILRFAKADLVILQTAAKPPRSILRRDSVDHIRQQLNYLRLQIHLVSKGLELVKEHAIPLDQSLQG
ncbi:hypothetical protein BOTBODRAFT_48916 [Botryobasidium botryosum FD-172 SS1]|uniref:Uncharacterized protein n=1 Tax=Botryobasidium botryosum (strain FD-172 SS1) TaxID=930990 RepID=A0A067M5Z0_BOTB1|nr:hypothetical protein BOTBODRAFT_48916 [Botryobasidium botryosum FD-172 SS1]